MVKRKGILKEYIFLGRSLPKIADNIKKMTLLAVSALKSKME